jgi:Flp pilus assembly protein TadG
MSAIMFPTDPEQSKTMPAHRRSGNSIIELTFMMPWLLFLFVGVFDTGFYCYALIATQNAARAVAIHNSISKTAATDPDGSGCQIAVFELKTAAYGRTMTSCAASPLQVTSTLTKDSNGNDMANVVVTYQSAVLIPIPGLLSGQVPIIGAAHMMVNPSADF